MPASPARVLIVEDEMLIAMAIETALEDAGHEVCGIVRSGEAALRTVRDHPPDLVLLDVTLAGEMDGVAAADALRGFWSGPIVFHTAYSDQRIRQRISALPNSYFLAKPSHPGEIIQAVAAALSRCGRR